MPDRHFPEVFDWITDYIPRLESIDSHQWAELLKSAAAIRDETEALYAIAGILRDFQQETKLRHRKYTAIILLDYLDWILVPRGFLGKLRKFGKILLINLVAWFICIAFASGIISNTVPDYFMIWIAITVAVFMMYQFKVILRVSPIYRNYWHMAGIMGYFLGGVIGYLVMASAQGWVLFAIGGYAVGVFSASIFAHMRPFLRPKR